MVLITYQLTIEIWLVLDELLVRPWPDWQTGQTRDCALAA